MAATSATPVIGGDTTGSGAGGGSLQRQYDEAALDRNAKKMDEISALSMREGFKLDKLSVFSRKKVKP